MTKRSQDHNEEPVFNCLKGYIISCDNGKALGIRYDWGFDVPDHFQAETDCKIF